LPEIRKTEVKDIKKKMSLYGKTQKPRFPQGKTRPKIQQRYL
jgi:hypothetical protein